MPLLTFNDLTGVCGNELLMDQSPMDDATSHKSYMSD